MTQFEREIKRVQALYVHKFDEYELMMIEEAAYITAWSMVVGMTKLCDHKTFKEFWNDQGHDVVAILEAAMDNNKFKGTGKKKPILKQPIDE